jgi:AP-1 complex subunit beta-1
LLDFDEAPAADGAPLGLAATQVLPPTSQTAAANLLAGTSSNPLDDLVSIFGNVGVGAPSGVAQPAGTSNAFGGLDFSASPISPGVPQGQMSMMAGLGNAGSTGSLGGVSGGQAQQNQQQSQQEDLLGLF